ncbi:MAG: transcriptional regulator [Magnetococcales bacterium]|nr:transcriptional regulator [Magnetococcales bacterium]
MNQKALEEKLQAAFAPFFMKLENESHLHAGHAGVKEKGGSHYSLVLVADSFLGKNRVERQRMVYELLAEEMQNKDRAGLHALKMKIYSVDEWQKKG